jgi:hypothetical protein
MYYAKEAISRNWEIKELRREIRASSPASLVLVGIVPVFLTCAEECGKFVE